MSYTLTELQTLRNSNDISTYTDPSPLLTLRENTTLEQYISDATADICNNVIMTLKNKSANYYFFPCYSIFIGDCSSNIVSNVQNIFPDLTVIYLDEASNDLDIGSPSDLVIQYGTLRGVTVKWNFTDSGG